MGLLADVTSRITGKVEFVLSGMAAVNRSVCSDPSTDKWGRSQVAKPVITTSSHGKGSQCQQRHGFVQSDVRCI